MATGRKAIELTNNTFPQLLARAFRAEVQRLELSRYDVCDSLGVSISTYYRIYNGDTGDTSGMHIDAIARMLKTDVVTLLSKGFKDAGTKPPQRRSNRDRGKVHRSSGG